LTARAVLKAETRVHHERVDAIFSCLDLSDPGQYRRFLAAQAGPFLAVEAALDRSGLEGAVPDWPARRRSALLRADLEDLGLAIVADPLPQLDETASQLGALYVLEGSRLGGAVLKRHVPASSPCRFLNAVPPKGSWARLLEILEEHLYGTERIGLAVEAAKAVFARFEAAGRRSLETEPA
jgi:heme oxygenase (biliverdin-IX-beta and delta-forming)